MLSNAYEFLADLSLQERSALRGRDREQMWSELLKVLRPGERKPNIVIPEVDDFDPDLYGKPVEEVVEGEMQEGILQAGVIDSHKKKKSYLCTCTCVHVCMCI